MARRKSVYDNNLTQLNSSKAGEKLTQGSVLLKKELQVDNCQSPSTESQNSQDSCTVISVKVEEEPSKLSSLKEALKINTLLREKLQGEIEKFKKFAKVNLENKTALKDILADDRFAKAKCKPISSVRAISVFAAPYFRNTKKMVPPANEDAKMKLRNNDVTAYTMAPKSWQPEETKKLVEGVTSFALVSALKPYNIRKNHLKAKLLDKNLTDENEEKIIDELADIEEAMERVKEKPLKELLNNLQGKIDWMVVSALHLEGFRTPDDCENFWRNVIDYKVNKKPFTSTEDAKLKDLAEEFNERKWDTIAECLKTNRTAIQVFERYQVKLSTNLTRRYWTPEEDQKLINLVEKMRLGKIIPWNKICLLMEGRTRQQIINRYERSISQAYNRGPWTPEEDAILYACVQKFGLHWSNMKPYFRRRSTYSIRERYVNALDPSVKMGYWTKEEDILLIALIRKFGYGKWSKICKHIPGRTDNMCLVRAGRLLSHSVQFHFKKYNKDYDTSVFDPALFGRIMRPIAPTKFCRSRNIKLSSDRENAIDMFLVALKKVKPSLVLEEEDVNNRDFCLNHDTLLRVSDELHRMLQERESKKDPFVPNIRYLKRERTPRKREYPESDTESEYQEETEQQNEQLSENRRQWLDGVLKRLFHPTSKVLLPPQRKFQHQNTREYAESTLYKAYLYKQFKCKAPYLDADDDLDNVVFNGVDYSETMHTVVSYFLQPPVYENQSMVMAPNLATLGCMEQIEAIEERLQSMSQLVRFSQPYMEYISERSSNSPTCLQCLREKETEIPMQVSPDIMFSDLEGKYFIVDQTMKDAAHVESACPDRCPPKCCCAELKKSRDSVRLLRQRTMGLLLWPALLSSTKLSEEQANILCNPSQYNETNKNYYMRMKERGRPPGSKNKIKASEKKRVLKKRRCKGAVDASSCTSVNEENVVNTVLPVESVETVLEGNSVEMGLGEKSKLTELPKKSVETKLTVDSFETKLTVNSVETKMTVNSVETKLTVNSVNSEFPENSAIMKHSENVSEEASLVTLKASQKENISTAQKVKKRSHTRRFTELAEGEQRRSKRSCVLNRASFSFDNENSEI